MGERREEGGGSTSSKLTQSWFSQFSYSLFLRGVPPWWRRGLLPVSSHDIRLAKVNLECLLLLIIFIINNHDTKFFAETKEMKVKQQKIEMWTWIHSHDKKNICIRTILRYWTDFHFKLCPTSQNYKFIQSNHECYNIQTIIIAILIFLSSHSCCEKGENRELRCERHKDTTNLSNIYSFGVIKFHPYQNQICM